MDDQPNGMGVKIMADGMQYSGDFRNGSMYGSGTIVTPDGNRLKVKWQTAPPPQKEDNLPDTAASGPESEKNWYFIAIPEKADKPLELEPQPSVGQMKKALQEPAPSAGEIARREPGLSAEPLEQLSPQAPAGDEVAAEEQVQEETITDGQAAEAEKTKPEAAPPAEQIEGPVPEAELVQNPESAKAGEYADIAVGANIRSAPSLDSAVLRTFPAGYPVAVLEVKEKWYLVEDFRERKGWVFASLVTEPGTVIVKVSKANLRSAPSLQDEIIVQLDYGTILPVIERGGEWLKVSASAELTGWLHHKVVWP
jgi:SH3-like domain-containing protein